MTISIASFSFFLENPKPAQQQQGAQPAGGNLVRNQRRIRVRAAEPQAQHAPAQQQQQQQNDSDDEAAGGELDEKMGAKKRAKLEAKAEKRAQREAELKSREEQKKRDGKSQDSSLKSVLINNFTFKLWRMTNARSWRKKKHSKRKSVKRRNVSVKATQLDCAIDNALSSPRKSTGRARTSRT